MKGWITDTKRIYDATKYNTFIGTVETSEGKQQLDITPVAGQNDGLTVAEALANLLVELKDVSRDFNDYGFLRSYAEGDLRVIWNAKHYNAIKKIDLPVVFHNDGLLNEFDQTVLPARYFGTVVGTVHSNNYTATGDEEVRSLVEKDITVGGKAIQIVSGRASAFFAKCAIEGAHGIESTFHSTMRYAMLLLIHKNERVL